MAHYLKLHLSELKEYLELKYGIPSHDTFSRIMQILETKQLMYSLGDWCSMLVDIKNKQLIIDGKGIIAATEKNKDKDTPYIINVIEAESKLVLMQWKVGEKTNEIKGIIELLNYLTVNGAVVTIDAIGTQKSIIQKIEKGKGGFVLPVKDNQSNLKNDILTYLDESIKNNDDKINKYVENAKNHGRNEKRTYYSMIDASCILDDEFKKYVKTIGKVVRETEKNIIDENRDIIKIVKTKEEVIYISNLEMNAKTLGSYIRNHWIIEDSLHWVLDNTFKEDRMTNKKGNSMENSAFMRKIAYNILRLFQQKQSTQHSFEYLIDELSMNISETIGYVCNPIELPG